MKQELEEQLFKKYPKIFGGRDKDLQENLMGFGFECGDGWAWLIDNLCASIQWHLDQIEESNKRTLKYNEILELTKTGDFSKFDEYFKGFAPGFLKDKRRTILNESPRELQNADPVIALQVKEKFGGLRFYVGSAPEYVHNIISFAESLSYHICELCGSTKDIGMTQGWLKTVCKSCAETDQWVKSRQWKLNEV